mmetsp:Transcript_2634/g.8135  ORF Transcript_2634/g.8135 Transcript_2634/m.8135 type:complete len:817 (-) Transcript_2634:151-2601(-)
MHRIFWRVPWPSWIGRPEPEFLKNLPGGVVSAGTVVIIFFGILWQVIKAIVRCCIRKKDIKHHEEAADAAGGAAALEGCIGPKLVLVLKQEKECKAPSACCTPLLNPESPIRREMLNWLRRPDHGVCVPVNFPEGSDLHKREVWVLGITEEDLKSCAETFGKPKLVDPQIIEARFVTAWSDKRPSVLLQGEEPMDVSSSSVSGNWFLQHTMEVERVRLMDRLHDRSGRYHIWLPYSKAREGLFKQSAEGKSFFSPSETIRSLMNIMGHATDGRGIPVFLAGIEVGEVEAIFPLIDQKKDKDEYKQVLKSWRSVCFWRPPPVEDVARLFGPSVALYFSYMQMYAMNLVFPALIVIGSFVWHIQHRSLGLNIHWGAAFGEGWSQATWVLVLSTWSTIWFLQWQQRISADVCRLGQDKLHKDTYSIDSTNLYFKRRGFKMSKKHGVYINKRFRPQDRSRIPRLVFTYIAISLFLGTTFGIIAGLCWISDKAALVTYSHNKSLDEALKNIISALSYLVISTPLQGVYDKLTRWLTELEDIQEFSDFTLRLVRRRAFFQIVNYMGWFLYLGFFSQDMIALRSQLSLFFVLKPSGLLGTIVELLTIPCFPRHKEYEQHELVEMIEQEWNKIEPNLFDEYLEVTLIFAGAILFAPVFPEGLVIALLHTIFEIIADKVKLFQYMRVQMPLNGDFFAISSWMTIWQGLSWLSIFVSTWLVNEMVSSEHLSEQKDTWDPNDEFQWDFLFRGLPFDQRRIYTIVVLEHLLLVFKTHLNITLLGSSTAVDLHREIVNAVLEASSNEVKQAKALSESDATSFNPCGARG